MDSSPDDVARACLESKADVVVVEGEAQLKKVLLVQHKLPELRALVREMRYCLEISKIAVLRNGI